MQKLKWLTGVVVVMGVALVGVAEADAGTATSNLGVSATVSSTCSITAGSLAFGAYDPVAGTQIDGTATISVSCTRGATATVTLGQGANANAGSTDTVPLRRMKDSGTNRLSYSLFSESTRTTTWGNTAPTGLGYTASSSSATALTVFGRITSAQDVPAGSYTDTVLATITF